MASNEEFINEISQVSPSNNVTDETFNTPMAELQHNIKFLANLITNSGVVGAANKNTNLLNYDGTGSLISQNGGLFNTFETKNAWIAIENNVVVNDTKVHSDVPLDLLIWNGVSSTQETSSNSLSWIEKDIYVPPEIRGMELIFAIKGTGLTSIPTDAETYTYTNGEVPECSGSQTYPTTSAPASSTSAACARNEDVLVEIIGSSSKVLYVATVGPWANHPYFAVNPDWLPKYKTQVLSFKTSTSTASVKIKIYRTRSDGAVAFSNMFVGCLPRPYAGWKFNNIDINEFYDFKSGIIKLHATTVMGHHVASDNNYILLSNLVTAKQSLRLQQFCKEIPEYDWDQISGPRHIELDNENVDTPKVSVFEFDSSFDRYLHFKINVDGPDPGLAYLGFNYFTTYNEFSNGGYGNGVVNFAVYVKVVNPGDPGNPSFSSYTRFDATVTVPTAVENGGLGYFEIKGDFFKDLKANRGAMVYFVLAREVNAEGFGGNFCLAATKMGLAEEPEDLNPGTYNLIKVDC